MPRDASGIYTLPAGNPVVTDTIIATTWANPTMADIAAQLNNVVTRDGVLGFSDPAKFPDGTAAAPGVSFTSDPDVGLYRASSNVLGISTGGVERIRVDSTGTVRLGSAPEESASFVPQAFGKDFVLKTILPGMAASFVADSAKDNGISSVQFKKSGVNRWSIFCSNGAETGGNAGSNFAIASSDDAGNQMEIPFFIDRQTSQVILGSTSTGNIFSVTKQGPNVEAVLRSISGMPILTIDGTGANNVAIRSTKGGVPRWNVYLSEGTPETGGNTGSNFAIQACSDAGVPAAASSLTIMRSTGIVSIKTSLSELKLETGTVKDVIDALTARIAALEAA